MLAMAAGALLLAGCAHKLEWRKETLRQVYDTPEGFYCYAPTIVRQGSREQILACHNSEPGIIRDDIYHIESAAGGMKAVSVFKAGSDKAWDSFHVCDPSVVSGKFRFQGVQYPWAMFYLGNNVDASRNNQVGVAFAKNLRGPWHRHPEPLVPHPPVGVWGTGQPSAVYDGRDRLLLFYTTGIPPTAGYVREVDLRDMAAPRVGPEIKLSTNGLMRANGSPDHWNNFEMAYDLKMDRFWALREKRPYPANEPTKITSHLEVVSLPASDILNSNAQWRVEGVIDPELTGHLRNHNAAFVRTPTGALPSSDAIRIVFATSCAGDECRGKLPLWTYDLWEITGRVGRGE